MNLISLFKKKNKKRYAKAGRDYRNIEKLQEIGRDLNYYI